MQRELGEAHLLLEEGARGLAGVAVERKRFAVVVHTRRAESDSVRQAAAELATNTVAQFGGLRLTVGKEISELRPAAGWDKGRAVGLVLDSLSPERTPLYIGDDRTDEDGFGEATRRQGVGVVVGQPETTSARFSLVDPAQVLQFLRQLSEMRKPT